MSISSRIYSFYKATVTGNQYRRLVVLPKSTVYVHRKANLKIGKYGQLSIGQNWTNLPFLITGLKIDVKGSIYVRGRFKIYSGSMVAVYENARLELGSGYLNNFCDLHCFEKITIGNNVIISSHVNIRDSDNHVISGQKGPISAPIIIEDNVWIGMRATILKGVTIGRGSVVAAGALVTKDVPPFSLVAGVPAKVIREEVAWH